MAAIQTARTLQRGSFSALALLAASFAVQAAPAKSRYTETILADKPAAYWPLKETDGAAVVNLAPTTGAALNGVIEGRVALAKPGQPNQQFPEFEPDSVAAAFEGGFIRVKDPGADSPLDFKKGDSITLEAWVFVNDIKNGQHGYIVGKGRTGNKGFAADNQNYALRVTGQGDEARLNFLFRSAASEPVAGSGSDKHWHRWTATEGIAPGSGWHHVAVTYTFGKGSTLRGYIDGEAVKGAWDMGGQTDAGPVVDDDEVWIGSSMGGRANISFNGLINEVAIHRRALSAADIKKRFNFIPAGPAIAKTKLPKDAVLVEIVENLGANNSWNFIAPEPVETYTEPAFGFAAVPQKYSPKGVRIDRSAPFMIRASAAVKLPKGEHTLLLRSLQAARLFLDGKLIAVTPFIRGSGDGHGEVPPVPENLPEGLRFARMGHEEVWVTVTSEGREQVFVLEGIVGGRNLRPDVGELSVTLAVDADRAGRSPLTPALSPREREKPAAARGDSNARSTVAAGDPLSPLPKGEGQGEGKASGRPAARGSDSQPTPRFYLLAPRERIPHTDEGWTAYLDQRLARLDALNAQRRKEIADDEAKYWATRHELARGLVAKLPAPRVPEVSSAIPVHNDIDRFIGARLEQAGVQPAPITDDYAFLRRVALDTIGLPPTPEQIREFLSDQSVNRRARAIDRFLAHPGWADHWVSYWQDVLAENPGILKPTLNNTGPFRWWIHESFADNKPMDRFATELIMMEGSVYGGGPAGFGLATQNDVPMADRAQVLSSAFLAMNLACARCHDAPYHDFKQQDLFSLAAALKRAPEEVPASSSIPPNANIKVGRLVNVTLNPGEKVEPAWPFAAVMHDALPEGVVRDPKDHREQLAAFVTDPRNARFAKVLVNRLWKSYTGWGLIEPVDDWETAKASHPDLLDWLARELMTHNYDFKHVARLILNSHTYQRQAGLAPPKSDKPEDRLFASPARRRLTAEQAVDSIFAVVGKPFDTEPLTLDQDARRPAKDFLNLGVPRRAWEFTGFANDRDRPALSMPRAQAIVDVLAMFGWRDSRQSALSARDDSPNVLQPATLANGDMVNGRVTRLCDGGAVTELCVQEQPLPALIEQVFLRVLARPPTLGERTLLVRHLEAGYARRVLPAPPKSLKKEYDRQLQLSWSNHLNAKATDIKLAAEEKARQGDPPTPRLRAEWRERMEDALWAMVNSPEFLFVP